MIKFDQDGTQAVKDNLIVKNKIILDFIILARRIEAKGRIGKKAKKQTLKNLWWLFYY